MTCGWSASHVMLRYMSVLDGFLLTMNLIRKMRLLRAYYLTIINLDVSFVMRGRYASVYSQYIHIERLRLRLQIFPLMVKVTQCKKHH